MRQVAAGKVRMFPRHEMLELIVIGGRARGIVTRDMVTGTIQSHLADAAVVLGTGGYGNVFYLAPTYAKGCNGTAIWRAYKKGGGVRKPLLHPDPPDLHPGARRVPVEADADERVAPERRPHLGAEADGRNAGPGRDPGETIGTTTWSACTRPTATSPPGTSPRAPRSACATRGAAWGRVVWACTSTSPTPSDGWERGRSPA